MRYLIAIIGLISFCSADAQVIRAEPFYVSPEDVTVAVCSDSLLDCVTGAAIGVSTRLLDINYTGKCMRVRRSSDNTEQDIDFVSGHIDTASMKSFADDTITRYTSNFSAGADSWTASNGTATGNIDGIWGEDNVLRFNPNTTNATHLIQRTTPLITNQRYKVRFKYYIRSANTTMTALFLVNLSAATTDTFTHKDAWVTDSLTGVATAATIQIRAQTGLTSTFAGNTADTFYVKDIEIIDLGTNTDLFVATWYNQADSSGVFGTRNFTQTTASNQPRIMDNLVVDRMNGVPSVFYTGSTQVMLSIFNPSVLLTGDLSYYFVLRRTGAGSFPTIMGTRTESTLYQNRDVYMKSDASYAVSLSLYGADYCSTTKANNTNTTYFYGLNLSGTTGSTYQNNVLDCSGSYAGQVTPSATNFFLGRRISGSSFVGYINDVIVYNSNKNADNTAVYTNSKNYFGL